MRAYDQDWFAKCITANGHYENPPEFGKETISVRLGPQISPSAGANYS
jgi:hypothetical protein